MLFSLAGKYSGGVSLPEHKYVGLLDHGGLWKVSSDVTTLFAVAGNVFKTVTAILTTKIDSEKLAFTHARLYSHYKAWSYKKEEKDEKDIGKLFRKTPKHKGSYLL